jgi:hypothetical protein
MGAFFSNTATDFWLTACSDQTLDRDHAAHFYMQTGYTANILQR